MLFTDFRRYLVSHLPVNFFPWYFYCFIYQFLFSISKRAYHVSWPPRFQAIWVGVTEDSFVNFSVWSELDLLKSCFESILFWTGVAAAQLHQDPPNINQYSNYIKKYNNAKCINHTNCSSSQGRVTHSLIALWWRHNGRDGVSNHQPHDCLLNGLFRRRSKKTSKLRVTGLCVGTGEFPAQTASNAENVSIWWRHHGAAYISVDEMGHHRFR